MNVKRTQTAQKFLESFASITKALTRSHKLMDPSDEHRLIVMKTYMLITTPKILIYKCTCSLDYISSFILIVLQIANVVYGSTGVFTQVTSVYVFLVPGAQWFRSL